MNRTGCIRRFKDNPTLPDVETACYKEEEEEGGYFKERSAWLKV